MPRQSDPGAAFAVFPAELEPVAAARPIGYIKPNAPVAQLDRALPSEGKGHTFESCRVRHSATPCRSAAPLQERCFGGAGDDRNRPAGNRLTSDFSLSHDAPEGFGNPDRAVSL